MTVREFIQAILLEAPSLDAEICISRRIDDIETENYIIDNISSEGSSDELVIYLEDNIYES